MRHLGEMATPWLGINYECSAAINAELDRTWHEPELVSACQRLTVPTLIIDGKTDIRPRWAVDSLEQALPMVTRVELTTAGHVPWLDAPGEFSSVLLEHLRSGRARGSGAQR
jgi:proline iminopeptidase